MTIITQQPFYCEKQVAALLNISRPTLRKLRVQEPLSKAHFLLGKSHRYLKKKVDELIATGTIAD